MKNWFKKQGVENFYGNIWPDTPPPREPRKNRNVIESVYIPFSPEDWCTLCTDSSPGYLGGCCGQMSAAQDILNYQFRFGYNNWSASRLWEFIETVKGHDGFDILDNELDDKLYKKYQTKWDNNELYLIEKICLVFMMVKDYLTDDKTKTPTPTKLKEPYKSVSVLVDALSVFRWGSLFSHQNEEQKQRAKAEEQLNLAKAIPACKSFIEWVNNQSNYQPRDLYAIFQDNEVCEMIGGLALFQNEKQCQEIIDKWTRISSEVSDERHDRAEIPNFKIKKVHISLKKGLEIIQ